MGYKPTNDVTDAPDLASNLAAIAADMRGDLPEHLRGALDAFIAPELRLDAVSLTALASRPYTGRLVDALHGCFSYWVGCFQRPCGC